MTVAEGTLDILANRMPQMIMVAATDGGWEILRPLDEERSVLVDLWAPEHTSRGKSAEDTRVSRLEAGLALIKEGFRLEDGRGSALSMLLDWYVPDPVSMKLSRQEEDTWVQVFEALHWAGQSLEAPPLSDFEKWMERDTWGWLAGQAIFEPVARALLKKGILRVYIPPQPNFKRWPKDPTVEVLDRGRFVNPSVYWKAAIRQGYPLNGLAGPRFITRIVEWDMTGQTVREALATGQVDLHLHLGKEGAVLGTILCSPKRNFISMPALLALLESDSSILQALDSQERPLHAVLLEYLSEVANDYPEVLGLALNQQAAEKIGTLTRSYRLSLQMESELGNDKGSNSQIGRL